MAEDKPDTNEKQARHWRRNYAKFVAKYWADEKFRVRVQKSPEAELIKFNLIDEKLLAKRGVDLVETPRDKITFVVPQLGKDLDVEMMEASHTFGTTGTIATAFCFEGCLGTIGSFFTIGCAGGGDDEPEDPKEPDDTEEPEDTDTSEGDTGDQFR